MTMQFYLKPFKMMRPWTPALQMRSNPAISGVIKLDRHGEKENPMGFAVDNVSKIRVSSPAVPSPWQHRSFRGNHVPPYFQIANFSSAVMFNGK